MRAWQEPRPNDFRHMHLETGNWVIQKNHAQDPPNNSSCFLSILWGEGFQGKGCFLARKHGI